MVGPPIQERYRGKRWSGWNSDYIMVYHRKSFLNKMDEITKFAQDNNCRLTSQCK